MHGTLDYCRFNLWVTSIKWPLLPIAVMFIILIIGFFCCLGSNFILQSVTSTRLSPEPLALGSPQDVTGKNASVQIENPYLDILRNPNRTKYQKNLKENIFDQMLFEEMLSIKGLTKRKNATNLLMQTVSKKWFLHDENASTLEIKQKWPTGKNKKSQVIVNVRKLNSEPSIKMHDQRSVSQYKESPKRCSCTKASASIHLCTGHAHEHHECSRGLHTPPIPPVTPPLANPQQPLQSNPSLDSPIQFINPVKTVPPYYPYNGYEQYNTPYPINYMPVSYHMFTMTLPPPYSTVTEKRKKIIKHKRPTEIIYEDEYGDDYNENYIYPHYVYKDTNSYDDSKNRKDYDDDDNYEQEFKIQKDTVFAVKNRNSLLDALGKDLKKYFRKSVLDECFCSALSNAFRSELSALLIFLCVRYYLFD